MTLTLTIHTIGTRHSDIIPMSFRCHSDVVLLSFRCRSVVIPVSCQRTRHDKVFPMERPKNENISRCRVVSFQNEAERKKASFEGTTGTMWERSALFVKRGPNGGEGRPNDTGSPVVPFFVPVVRTTFLVRESFWIVPEGKEILEWRRNEVETRRAGGQKWECFPLWKQSFQRHSTIVLIQPEMTKAMSRLKTHKWPQNDKKSQSAIILRCSIVPESFELV